MYAAIAFVGRDSYRLFHENIRRVKDVRFVVNFSDNSVRSGSINPAGVSQLQTFAEVRNREDLHAKIYVFDHVALVSSANLSKNATSNVEAGVLVEDPEEVSQIVEFFHDLWDNSSPVGSELLDDRLRAWIETDVARTKRSLPTEAGVVRRPKNKGLEQWKTPIPAPDLGVRAIVWSVGRGLPGMEENRRKRRDVELHIPFVEKHGAVFWSASWNRCYITKPLNGYLYISQDGAVKYHVRVEKIVRSTALTHEDRKFIPNWRKGWEKRVPTWIKITGIRELEKPIMPTSMIKWKDRKPIKNASALQSAILIVDKFWD